MRRPGKKTLVLLTAVVLVAIGAGTAFAYWTNSGSGSGTGSTGTNSGFTVNQTGAPADLRPGGGLHALAGTFTNPDNNGTVRVVGVTFTITVAQAPGAVGTCDASDYTLTQPTLPTTTDFQDIDQDSVETGTWSGGGIEFNNKDNVDQDGCKGATVTFHYTAS